MAATTEGDGAPSNREEQTTYVAHSDTIQIDKSTSETMLSVLSTIQESMNSSNLLLRELLQQKRKSESSEHTELAAKPKKLDSDESQQAVKNASQKAKVSTSHEVHDSASDEAQDLTSEEANTKPQDDDAISLFGDDSLINVPSDPEDELNNDELLTQITISLSSSDETGPPVSEKLSKLVNDKFQTEYSVEKRKEILQKYKIPSNCTELSVPKVDPEIWGNLTGNSKRSDIRMSVLQDTLLKVSSAIIVTVGDLLGHREKKTSPDYKTLIPRLTDSIALIGYVHNELSFKRRDAIRPFLNQEFKQACSRTLKPGKLLFGEDLPKTLQELKATNKIMNKVTPSNNKGSNSQKNRYGSSFRSTQFRGNQSSKPFLGSKGGNAYPPRANQQQNRFQPKKNFTKS